MKKIILYACLLAGMCLTPYQLLAEDCANNPCCNTQCYYSYPNAGSPFYRYKIKEEKTSQSFMFFHPAYQQTAMRQSLWHNFVYNKCACQGNAFQLIGLYEHSIDSKATAKYFLPFYKCDDDPSRFVAGDNAGINENDSEHIRRNRDIRAEWLGLPSNFSGNFSINPQQRQTGFIIEGHTQLDKYLESPFVKDFWLSLCIPILSMDNNLNVKQWNIRNSGNSEPQDIKQALCQPTYRYGKLCCSRSTVQAAEVEVRAGRAYYSNNGFQLIYYSGVTFPSAPRQNAEYLFDPYVGYNGHWGMEAGFNGQLALNQEDAPYVIALFANLETVFLQTNKQHRTFDLKCKPWSRFLQFVRKDGPPDALCPGVNILTHYMRVYPYNMTDFSTGFRITSDKFEGEIGYSVWGHGDERLEYMRNWDESLGYQDWGITGTFDPQVDQYAVTASNSTIGCQAENDAVFTPIGQCDIDLNSGRARSVICHKAHFSIGALHKGCHIDSFAGAGAFVELPQDNTALNRWGFWAKCGAVF